jgi:hypothetical protein
MCIDIVVCTSVNSWNSIVESISCTSWNGEVETLVDFFAFVSSALARGRSALTVIFRLLADRFVVSIEVRTVHVVLI